MTACSRSLNSDWSSHFSAISTGRDSIDLISRLDRSHFPFPSAISTDRDSIVSLHTILHTNDDYAKLCYFMLNYAPYAKLCSAMLLLCKLCLMLGLCDYATKQCWHHLAAPRSRPGISATRFSLRILAQGLSDE